MMNKLHTFDGCHISETVQLNLKERQQNHRIINKHYTCSNILWNFSQNGCDILVTLWILKGSVH